MKNVSIFKSSLVQNPQLDRFVRSAFYWLLMLSMVCFCVSCATWEKSQIDTAEMAEFHGDHNAFWPYANAGDWAAGKGDWATSRLLYLRAYRNTGMVLAPREDSQLATFLFGLGADMMESSKIEAYAKKLDTLTPLPGSGRATNDLLDTEMNYQRSLAAYNWARAAGQLGDFEVAEKAFLYSLNLEQIRGVPERDKYISTRHYELARLYHAWGKTDMAIYHYLLAVAATPNKVQESDPVGYANALEEFSTYLKEAGRTDEAAQLEEKSAQLRRQNPGKKARFKLLPYPERSAP